MFSPERTLGAFFSRKIFRTVVALLAGAMVATTAVTGFLGIRLYLREVGEKRFVEVVSQYGWIAIATAAAEGVALLVGIVIIWRLLKRLSAAADEMQLLTRSVLHDLSTPLAHIDQTMELLYAGTVDAETARADIHTACARLLSIIRTNAEISRTYEGLEEAGATAVDFAAVIRTTEELYSAAAEEKGVRLTVDVPAEKVMFHGHLYRVQRLVANLVDNAIKYTPKGGEVAVALAADAAHIRLVVRDTGIGLSAADKARVFERFFRAERSRSTPGTGLGLALVHALVASYKGTITLDSEPDRGTTVTVTL